jgi:MFS family permease
MGHSWYYISVFCSFLTCLPLELLILKSDKYGSYPIGVFFYIDVKFIYMVGEPHGSYFKSFTLKNVSFSAYNLSMHLNYVCMYMIIFVMPFYLLKVLNLSPNTTGLVLTASPLLIMFLAPVSGIISDKFGSRPLSFIGALICAVAFYSMTQLTIDSTEIDVFIRLALLGVGTAVFQSPTTRAIMAKIPDGQAGVASGILVTMRNLGMVFAICYVGYS